MTHKRPLLRTIMKQLVRHTNLFLLALLLIFHPARAQGIVIDEVNNAMRNGNATAIARHFDDIVDITINRNQSSYSSNQAEMVLKNWFSKNVPKDYTIEHSGASPNNNAIYCVGSINTSTGRYKVYMFFKPEGNDYVLQEIKLQK